jgi:uncharacterized protein
METAVTAQKVIVSEAGASVYSASELAAQEFPDLDVSLRDIVLILADANGFRVDFHQLGQGILQTAGDGDRATLSQTQLARKLDAVVEDCVNAVGVDLNTASVPLLTPTPMDFGSIFTSSARGSCRRRAMETAPRSDTSRS